jgi:hypothetical protein
MCWPWNHKFEEVGEREFGEAIQNFFGGTFKYHAYDYTYITLQCTVCRKFTQQELHGHVEKK